MPHETSQMRAPFSIFNFQFSILVLVALALTTTACRNSGDANTIVLNGRIEAPTVDLGPKVPGRVVAVLVREGQRVKAGELLVRLDLGETAIAVEGAQAGVRAAQARAQDLRQGSRESEISAAQADVADKRAAVALAEKEAERQRFLLSRKVGTQRELDRAQTDLTRSRAALKASSEKLELAQEGFRSQQTAAASAEADRAQAQLEQSQSVASESEIRAPADGVILHRLAEPGQLVSAGQPAMTMAFSNRLYVRTFIPETKLGQVRQGAAATVVVDAYPDKQFPAHITEIAPDAEFTPKAVETREERVNLVYAAKADLDRGWNEPLVPGQPAEVRVKVK